MPSFFGAYLCARATDRLAARDPRWFAWACAVGNAAFVPASMAFYLWPTGDRIGTFPIAFVWSILASILGSAAAPATEPPAAHISSLPM